MKPEEATKEVLIYLLLSGDDFEVTSWGNLGIYRLVGPPAQREHAGKWCVHWTDHANREEVFAEVEAAVERFLAVRALLTEEKRLP